MGRKISSATADSLRDIGLSEETIKIFRNAKWGRPQRLFRFDPECIVPFAPRWMGIKDPLGGKNNIRNMDGFNFELGWRQAMWEYFPIPQEGSVLYNLAVHWDWFIQHPPKAPAPIAEKLLNIQPLGQSDDDFPVDQGARLLAKPPKRRCIHEPMGWYVPAHFCQRNEYGIHLSQGGLVNAAAEVHALCPDEPRDVVLATMCHFAYCHEVAHAWIEDMCALLDFHEGCADNRFDRPYSLAYRKWGGMILMEESICDMAAFGLLTKFLVNADAPVRKSREIPRFNPKIILKATATWIEGRSDPRIPFQPIKNRPQESEEFIWRLTELVENIYGYSSAGDVITNFLGLNSPPEAPMARNLEQSDHVDTALNASDIYPVIVHLE